MWGLDDTRWGTLKRSHDRACHIAWQVSPKMSYSIWEPTLSNTIWSSNSSEECKIGWISSRISRWIALFGVESRIDTSHESGSSVSLNGSHSPLVPMSISGLKQNISSFVSASTMTKQYPCDWELRIQALDSKDIYFRASKLSRDFTTHHPPPN